MLTTLDSLVVITLTTFADARQAFRARELRQALYDDGEQLMRGVIVNLHGEHHIARRRLENRLFRRDTFAWYERFAEVRSVISWTMVTFGISRSAISGSASGWAGS